MSAKNVTVTVASVVVAQAGFINWIQGTGTTYTVAVNAQTDYITVTDTSVLAASGVAFTPAGGVAATTVQAAIEEVDTEAVKKATAQAFSVGGVLIGAPPSNANVMVWRAPFAATVTNVRGHAKGGTNAVVNARLNQTSNFLSSSLTVSSMDAWADGGAVQNTAIVAGDDIEIMLVSTSGAITEVTVQVDLTRTLS